MPEFGGEGGPELADSTLLFVALRKVVRFESRTSTGSREGAPFSKLKRQVLGRNRRQINTRTLAISASVPTSQTIRKPVIPAAKRRRSSQER